MNAPSDLFPVVNAKGAPSLWWGWIIAPSWWLTQFEVRYALVRWACEHDVRWASLGVGAAALIIASVIALMAWASRPKSPDEHARTFLAIGGVALAVSFALLTLAQMVPDLFIDLCRI